MSRKKPINSSKMFRRELVSDFVRRTGMPPVIVRLSGKTMARLRKEGYRIETVSELWYDGEEGLDCNNWVDEYSEGTWGMSQKDVDEMAKHIVSRFSHFVRRSQQKVVPRAYKQERGNGIIMYYLYMRDREFCDYAIFFKQK